MEDEGDRCPDEGYLLVRIHVPDLNVQKCLQFPRDQLIWDVKQQCLAALPKELKESFNYGLFCPPENGRAGKFLDEERRLGDYPFNGPVGYLELKYKRRVYKTHTLDEKQLKSLHTRANLRRFLDYVNNGQVEKITKMCSKGLDPNFHCQDSGETPLTLATSIKKPGNVLIALVNGGALLDYRTRDGTTTMHRAVEHKSLEAMKTLLELGASPNYKDSKGLTPLYLTISQNNEPIFTETLLHDHATIGAQDLQGWQEVHQACRTGMLQHLEHLLFYGADMDARNASGNTPLHVCAVNNQESCARQLLFRGANRQALNYANQTPYQVAVIAGNMELAEIIQNYRQQDVVVFRAAPSYNPKRRSAIGWLSRAPSMNCLALPPSPCPSDRSFAPYSSASSSVSEGSNLPHGNDNTDNASIITDKSLVDSDIISDSSGVGTANSDTTTGSISMPGTTVVCIEAYSAQEEGHISINLGDIIEVTAATDDGFLEGTVKSGKGRSGLFPANYVQEVKLRHPNVSSSMIVVRNNTNSSINDSNDKRVLGRRESNSKHFATAPRLKKTNESFTAEPRTVVLHRGRKGFGFILRGAKATSPLMELTPSGKCPALQYLDDVDPGGVADMAGLKKGDFLLEINKEDVSSASHEHVVDLIRKSGDLVSMTVVSLGNPSVRGTLPSSKSTIIQSGNQDIPLSRQYATLPRKVGNNGGNVAKTPAPMPPRRDPKTTLSVGKARAFSILPGLEKEETEELKRSNVGHHMSEAEYAVSSQPRTASIRQRPTSSRITTAELEELFERQRGGENKQTSLMTSSHFQGPNNHLINSPAKNRVYASVAEMKRSKSRGSNKVRFSSPGELHRDFHSTPDLAAALNSNRSPSKPHRSNEDISTGTGRALPPPTHPPPPPPTGQLVKVDVRSSSEYENFKNKENCEEGIVSSFRPTAPAKFYASPEDIKTVGYRSRSLPSHSTRTVRKSHSMRANSVFNKSGNSPPNTVTNPYAQPINKTTRSNSIAGTKKDRKKRVSSPGVSTPPIPEPDYSCSESESGEESKKLKKFNSRLTNIQNQPTENSGNSNASGSSSGSSSIPHSLSVDEIQKGRSLLKSSKSYPDDFLKKQSVVFEDGDNSSSGVSSDQEISMPNSTQDFERLSSQDVNSMTLPHTKTQRVQTGMMTRHAVSLAQLPPPIEDTDEKEEFCLPPPPEFGENGTCTVPSEAVLAPPPQFSDNRQNRVRIVGTVPKTVTTLTPKLKQGRLHSQ